MERFQFLFPCDPVSSDTLGERKDLSFLSTFEWLVHTRMLPQIVEEAGGWYLDLIFVHRASSLCFFRRRMKHFASRQEAVQLRDRYLGITSTPKLKATEAVLHSICPN